MVRMIDEHGPYIVVAPGLALAHARPGPEVRRDGLAVVTLANPVEFGHPYNDPVRVVLGVAASNESHLQAVAELANIFNDSDAVDRLARAASPTRCAASSGSAVGTDPGSGTGSPMKIVTICGAGVGTSGILKVNAERVLARPGLEATVVATDLARVASRPTTPR